MPCQGKNGAARSLSKMGAVEEAEDGVAGGQREGMSAALWRSSTRRYKEETFCNTPQMYEIML